VTPETLALMVQVLEALMNVGNQVPELVAAGKAVQEMLTSQSDPTPEQEQAILAGLAAADARLQAS
jgi:C4-dicarboxylate-specific signal transduction histidine kinase